MNTKTVHEITAWIKSTDLLEVSWKEKGNGIHIKLSGTGVSVPEPNWNGPSLTAVPSPQVGIFHASALGEPRKIEEGGKIEQGTPLGVVQTGPTSKDVIEIQAPVSGKIHKVLIEEGAPVQYGQPLFLIETR